MQHLKRIIICTATLLTALFCLPAAAGESDSGVSFTYELQQPGQVSAAVYNQEGRLVRTLLRAQSRRAGRHTLTWDGLDRLGEPQPPGEYTVKILRKPPFRREFIMQVGVNPNSEPYHRWVGDFGGGTSVAVDASGMYVSSRNAEGNFMLLKQSIDGAERMWARDSVDPWRGGLSLASDGETVYVLQQNGYITLFEAETGKSTGRWDVLPEEAEKKKKRRGMKYTDHSPLASMDMAVRGSTRVVSYRRHDRIVWLNEEGKTATTATVSSPRAVAVSPDSTVYVISGKKVLSVSENGDAETIVEGLANPWRLAYDAHNDDLLVAEGPDEWRIERFSASGELLATCGRQGGRREGPYVATDFKHFTDITADGRGGFFVAEPERPPRRVAHFDAEGQLIREWYGGLNFFSWRAIDPRDPTRVWYKPSSGPSLVLAEVDYANRTWSVRETHNPGNKAGGLGRGGGNKGKFHVRYHDGERYLVGESFPPMVFHHHDGRLNPVVMGNRGRHFPQAHTIAKLMGADDPKQWIRKHLGKRTRQKNTYLWIDQNADHQPQPDEITLHKLGNVYHGPGQGAWIGRDFSVIAGGGDYNPLRGEEDGATKFYTSLMLLGPTGWKNGVPQYGLPQTARELDVARMYVEPKTDAYIGRAEVAHTYRDTGGAYYAFYNWGGRGFGGFPNFQAGRYARLTKWSPGGERIWSVGRKASGANKAAIYWNPTQPGGIHYPTEIAGEVRDTIVVCDRIVNPGMAWTKDGLFAGSFFPGRVDDGLPGWVYAWQRDMETNTHSVVNHDCLEGGAITEHDGKVYFYSPGCNSLVLYRVHGYDREEWTRTEKTVRLDGIPPHAGGEGTGLRAEIHGGTKISGEPDAELTGVPPEDLTIPASVDTSEGVAVRLTGTIEVPLSEEFKFSVSGGGLRVWIDGKQVLERWNEDNRYTPGGTTQAVALTAGRHVPIQIDFHTTSPGRLTDPKKRSIPLRWESKNTDPNYVPGRFFHPAALETVETVEPRLATGQIHARSHDHRISSDAGNLYFDGFHCRRHMKGLGKGKHLGYREIDFGEGVEQFVINLRKGNAAPTKIQLRLDAPDGPVLDTITLPRLNIQYRKDRTLSFDLPADGVEGVHDLYLLTVAGRHGPRFRWFSFE